MNTYRAIQVIEETLLEYRKYIYQNPIAAFKVDDVTYILSRFDTLAARMREDLEEQKFLTSIETELWNANQSESRNTTYAESKLIEYVNSLPVEIKKIDDNKFSIIGKDCEIKLDIFWNALQDDYGLSDTGLLSIQKLYAYIEYLIQSA